MRSVSAVAAIVVCLVMCGCGGRSASSGRGGRRQYWSRRKRHLTVAGTGVRIGYVSFGGADYLDQKGRPIAGVNLRIDRSKPLVMELGIDTAVDIDEPGDRQIFIARGDLLYFPPIRELQHRLYFLVGGGAVFELVLDDTALGGYGEVAAGWLSAASGREIDFRIGYWRFFSSENVQKAVVFTVGCSF